MQQLRFRPGFSRHAAERVDKSFVVGSRPTSLKSQLALLFGGRMLEKAIAFVSLVVFARMLTPAELAVVPAFFIAASAAVMFAALGAMPVVMVELPRVAETSKESAGAMIRTVLDGYAIGSLVLLAVLAAYPGYDRLATIIGVSTAGVWLFSAGVVVHGAFTLLVQVLSALSRFGTVVKANTLVTALRLLFIVGGHHVDGMRGVLIGMLMTSMLGALYSCWHLRDHLAIFGARWGLGPFMKLSWPLYIEGFLMFFRQQGDQVVVGTLLGSEALAGYYLARRLSHFLKTISDALNVTLAPTLSRLSLKSDAEFSVQWRRYLALVMMFAVPCAVLFALLAPAHMAVVGGEVYKAFALPAAILCLGSVIDIVKGPVINRAVFVLYAPRVRVYLTAAEALILLPSLAWGAVTFGPTGVAVAVVVAGLLASLLGTYMLRKRLQTSMLRGELVGWLVPSCIAATVAGAVGYAVRQLPIQVYEAREVIAGGIAAVTFVVVLANVTRATTLAFVQSAFRDTRWQRAVAVASALRLRK